MQLHSNHASSESPNGYGNQYLYDGEGRICAVATPKGMFQYLYDADGTRVAKGTIQLVNNALSCDTTQNQFRLTASYILDLGGQQLTELDWTSGTAQWAHTNVWAAGQLIATYSTQNRQGILNFYFDDWLGSRRVMTDDTGNVQETCHSLPYGNGEDCGPVPTEHLFTGKERDSESGNDYFGARYYASTMGRFMSPDDGTGEHFGNPQSLNRYAYVFNNPLRLIDPSGHSTQTAANGDVLAVYDDKDLGVYRHGDIDNRADWDGSKLDDTDPQTTKMGETERWGEFAQVDKAHPDGIDGSHGKNATIMFGKSLDFQMKGWEDLAKMMGKNWTANESRNGGLLDIKSGEYGGAGKHLTGYLVGGKYMTIESAGNFLAGYNAVSTGNISPEFAQKIFGAYQQGGFSAAMWTRVTGKEYKGTQAPYWGEAPYSGFMQVEGENAAKH